MMAMLVVVFGCSSGGGNPTAPTEPPVKPAAVDLPGSMLPDGRVLWGAWKLGIDPVEMTVDVLENRELAKHWNVKQFLIPPTCSDCIVAKLTGIVGTNTYSIDITLKNPTVVTGYDVRATIFNTGVMELRNPDSYTLFLAHPGDSTPNPFIAYDTPQPNRAYPGGYSHKETFHIYNAYHPDYTLIDYVVDASWPTNCKEPYEVGNCHTTGSFKNDGSNSADILCDVRDWQDNVESVKIDLSVLGGDSNTEMTNTSGDTWAVEGVSWQTGGELPGSYEALITAKTEGAAPKRETYNYVTIIVTSAGQTGLFVNELANFPLEGDSAPTTCLDIAVVGDDDGASITMVVGADSTYHLWDALYEPIGGYLGLVDPFENMRRFDTASLAYPDDILTWAWVEVNDDPNLLDPLDDPPFNTPISWWVWIYWWDTVPDPHVSGWIFYEDPDELPPIDTYIEPFDACGGLNRDGMQYWASKYVDGDDTLYPYVGVYGFVNPYDVVESWAFVGYAPEGAGDGYVDKDAVNSVDVDDMEGYSEIYCVFSEGSPENVVEVYQYDFEQAIIDDIFDMTPYITIHPENEPIDIEIIPVKNLAQDTNWICILTSAGEVEVYKLSDGDYVTTFGDLDTISNEARFLDVDDLNYKVHIMQDGPQVSVFYYDP